MNRELITSKIIDILSERLNNLKESLKETEDSERQAPSAMESHSDTSRFQLGQLADNLRILIKNIEKVIKEIEKTKTTEGCVGQGSIVKIEEGGNELYYYISPMGLGESFLIEGKEFRVISVNTPIAKCLSEKKVGENVEIKTPNGSYFVKIIEIN